VRSSYRGLAPRLQRAHAGRTQRRGPYAVPAPDTPDVPRTTEYDCHMARYDV
jgi:hypothetical protein